MPRTNPRHRVDAAATSRSSSIAAFSRRHAARRVRRTPAVVAVATLAVTGMLSAEALDGGPDAIQTGLPSAVAVSEQSVAADVSRSAERIPLDQLAGESSELTEAAAAAVAEQKAAEEKARKEAEAKKAAEAKIEAAKADPRAAAQAMLADYGWSANQFGCLDSLWQGESNWDYTATNPSSGAYGIPQSLPATKMATAGDDWKTNPITQIKWGLGYIRDVYGSPCSANSFKSGRGWY